VTVPRRLVPHRPVGGVETRPKENGRTMCARALNDGWCHEVAAYRVWWTTGHRSAACEEHTQELRTRSPGLIERIAGIPGVYS
jgi:hypothetical protein